MDKQRVAVLVVYVAAVVWMAAPPWQRRQVVLRVLAGAQSGVRRLARRSGRAGMGMELAARPEAGQVYRMTEGLSRVRDRLSVVYGRVRP